MATILDRLIKYVDISSDSGCMNWIGSKSTMGYGRLSIKGKVVLAHRLVWEIAEGPIPKGMYIDHMCMNKACINTAHLRLVTPRQNTIENSNCCIAINYRKTHCNNGHPLSGDNLYIKPDGGRSCKECVRIRHRGEKYKKHQKKYMATYRPTYYKKQKDKIAEVQLGVS